MADAEDATERRQLEARLRELQKLAVIGQLAEGVAHDYNNIISATLIHLGLLLQDPQIGAAQRDSLKTLEKETTRAATLTRQLLTFSRRGCSARMEPLDLNEVIGDILKMARRVMRENLTVAFEASPGEAWVNADRGLMEQLVLLICLLARDTVPHGGALTFSTTLTDRIDGAAGASSEVRKGRFVCFDAICVSAPAAQKQPAIRREDGEHRMGIDSVRDIVHRHEGWLEMEEEEGRRLSFQIYLPAVAKPDLKAAHLHEAEAEKGGGETILLVEDELFLRRVSALSLRKLGYAVLDAGDGEEALKLWEKHRQKIDLLFTDLLLPGTSSGQDLAQQMKAEKPSLKIMLSSGHNADLEEHATVGGHRVSIVVKPYTAALLAKAVRECLHPSA